MDQTTTTTNRVSVIEDIKVNFKRMFSREYVKSSREDWIYNIVLKILDAPGTVKYTPSGDNYYLSNENYGYFVRIEYQQIYIICGNTTILEPCAPGFLNLVRESVRKQVEQEIEIIESKMELQGDLLLKRLDDSVAK